MTEQNKLTKKDKYVWTCDYCGKEFATKRLSDLHELKCEKNKNREVVIRFKASTMNAMFNFGSLFMVIYFLTYFVANSYAKGNSLPIRDLLQPHKWFSTEVEVIPTPLPSLIPTSIPTSIIARTIKPKTQVTTNTGNTGSQIKCIGPDGIQFKTTMDECKKLNETWGKPVDYMTNCTYPAECGGGVKYIKKSECDKPCTRVTNGTNTVNNNQANTINYPPCTIYYPSLNRSETYNYTSPSDCQKWKDSAAAGSTQIIPTSSYVAPTTYVYQTPTTSQADIDARISRCQGDCRRTGSSNETKIRNHYRASGGLGSSFFGQAIADNNTWVRNCVDSCH